MHHEYAGALRSIGLGIMLAASACDDDQNIDSVEEACKQSCDKNESCFGAVIPAEELESCEADCLAEFNSMTEECAQANSALVECYVPESCSAAADPGGPCADEYAAADAACGTRSSTFDCGNGTTIEIYEVCDDFDDCGNGADEQGC